MDRMIMTRSGKRTICPKCNHRFKFTSELRRHLNRKTSCEEEKEEKSITKCSDCRRVFSTKCNLQRHVKNGKCPGRPLQKRDTGNDCPFCHKMFSCTSSRNRHLNHGYCSAQRGVDAVENARLKIENTKLRDELAKAKQVSAAAPPLAPAAAAPVATAAEGSRDVHVAARDGNTISVDDHSVHIHVHGQEKMTLTPEVIAAIEAEIVRYIETDAPYMNRCLTERILWRRCQDAIENRTIRGLERDKVGVHMGAGEWKMRDIGAVASEQLKNVRADQIRQLRSKSDNPPGVEYALTVDDFGSDEEARWPRVSGGDLVMSIAENNERRDGEP